MLARMFGADMGAKMMEYGLTAALIGLAGGIAALSLMVG